MLWPVSYALAHPNVTRVHDLQMDGQRRITAIILAKELPRSYQNLNQAFAGYE